MLRLSFLLLAAVSPACFPLLAASPTAAPQHPAPAAGSRPNFLLILTDDLGYGDTSVYGAPDLSTPHLDRLASEGMLFTSMRANCTVCSPTRAAILTGKYADRVGVPGVIRNISNSWGYFDPSVPTLADRLGEVGYHTAIIGKWHLGLESPNTPNERGFDFFHGFLGDMMDDYYTHLRRGNNFMRRNGEVIQAEGHASELFSRWAIDYFEEHKAGEQPFFLYLAYNAPHFPIQPPEEWFERVRERDPQMPKDRARNVAFVEHLDHCIGRVLAALEETGLADSTLVVFTSDNGGSLRHAQRNLPWRDGKQSHYDGGLKVPFLVRWPGQVEPGSVSDYQGLTFDAFPTFLRLAGAPLPPELDAVDLGPIFKGSPMPGGRTLYFVRREGGTDYGGKAYHAIIRDGWKLMQNDPYSELELYHLEQDPEETSDLFAKEPNRARKMQHLLQDHIQQAGGIPWQPPAR